MRCSKTPVNELRQSENTTDLLQLPEYSELFCRFFFLKADRSASISFLQKNNFGQNFTNGSIHRVNDITESMDTIAILRV